jgi:hypothetical protein
MYFLHENETKQINMEGPFSYVAGINLMLQSYSQQGTYHQKRFILVICYINIQRIKKYFK